MAALTRTEARKALGWAMRVLNIEDWAVELTLQTASPKWSDLEDCDGLMGCCSCEPQRKEAQIWVSCERSEKNDVDPYAALFHEVMHIAARDSDIETEAESTRHKEVLWTRLAALMAEAYRKGVIK